DAAREVGEPLPAANLARDGFGCRWSGPPARWVVAWAHGPSWPPHSAPQWTCDCPPRHRGPRRPELEHLAWPEGRRLSRRCPAVGLDHRALAAPALAPSRSTTQPAQRRCTRRADP